MTDVVIKDIAILFSLSLLSGGFIISIKAIFDSTKTLKDVLKLNAQYQKQLQEIYPEEKYPQLKEYCF